MLSTFWLQAADDALGRIDRSTLTDQQKLEILVADLTPAAKAHFQDSNGMFREVRQWKGVKTNASDEPYLVRWEKKFLGTIALDFMPAKMTHFIVWACSSLEGTLDTEMLPECLKELILFQTALSGTVALENLPKSVFTYLNISKGNFSGTLNLENLPPKSKGILLHTNAFTGTIVLSKLPEHMHDLDISNNRLIGEVDLCQLPPKLRVLEIRGNKFCGEFCIVGAPWTLYRVSASENNFTGVATVERSMCKKVFLLNNKIEWKVDEHGKRYT